MGYEQAKTQYPWIRHMICKALLNIFEQRWFLCDHVCYQRNGTLCSIFPFKTIGWETRDFQLRHKIRSSKQKLFDKKHAWSNVIGSNFLLLLFTWILICGGVLSVIQKDRLCEKLFLEIRNIRNMVGRLCLFLIWMHKV